MESLETLKEDFQRAYSVMKEREAAYLQSKEAYERIESELAAWMLELGISKLSTSVGQVTPSVRYKGSFKDEELGALVKECHRLGKDVPVKLQAVYETPLSGEEAANAFSLTHSQAQKLSLTCHHGSFDKLLRENPSLLPLASYVQLVTLKVK